jgi:hypothetical protein
MRWTPRSVFLFEKNFAAFFIEDVSLQAPKASPAKDVFQYLRKKHLQYCDEMFFDRAIFSDWLEPYPLRNGSKKIRRGLPHFDHAFLSHCLWHWRLLLYSMFGNGL